MTKNIESLGWTWEMIEEASKWGFNCGPGALCAVTGKTPSEIRPHMNGFEEKGYTNPTLMKQALASLDLPYSRVFECKGAKTAEGWTYPNFGLVRIQWAGPWTAPGVPVRVRYRHTHWIATRNPRDREVFDVNAVCAGGWIPFREWSRELVPWLLEKCVPKANGNWWPTHCWEINPAQT